MLNIFPLCHEIRANLLCKLLGNSFMGNLVLKASGGIFIATFWKKLYHATNQIQEKNTSKINKEKIK